MAKVKVKVTLVQALRLCTGRMAHTGSRSIALPFLDHGIRGWWVVSVTPRPLFTPGEESVPIVQDAGWAPGPVWTGAEKSRPPPGFDPRTVQPVASPYTDYATRHTQFMATQDKLLQHHIGPNYICNYIQVLVKPGATDTEVSGSIPGATGFSE